MRGKKNWPTVDGERMSVERGRFCEDGFGSRCSPLPRGFSHRFEGVSKGSEKKREGGTTQTKES
jgi:hypothetical protein